jgi:DNA-binding IclR family transcriptional regulator
LGAVLDLFNQSAGSLRLVDICKALDLKKSTAHRLLNAMVQIELLDKDDTSGTYRLGVKLLRFGEKVRKSLSIRNVAEPIMRELAQSLNQTVFLSVLRGNQVVCIERISGSNVDIMAFEVGGELPLNCGAAPRVFLAYMGEHERNHYLQENTFPRLTSFTFTSREKLLKDIEQTHTSGYVLSWQDVTLGVSAIGVPIFGIDGSVVASLSVADVTAQYSDARLPIIVEEVKSAAVRISRKLGVSNFHS